MSTPPKTALEMPGKAKTLPVHIAGRLITGIVVFLVTAAIAVLVSADTVLNGVVKERILRDANSREGTSLSLAAMHYNLLSNRITCDTLQLRISAGAGNSIDLAANALSCSDINWLRVWLGDGVSCGAVNVDGLRAKIVSTKGKEPARDRSEGRKQESGASPRQLLPLIIGRLSARGGEFSRILRSRGETTRDSVSRFALEVGDLRLDSLSLDHLASSLSRGQVECELEQGGFAFAESSYRAGFASARLSDAESLAQVDSLEIRPSVSDEKFFAPNRQGLTRFRISTERLVVAGLGVAELFDGKKYAAGRISISRPDIDIVVNKRAPDDKQRRSSADSAKMPNEILADLNRSLRIDTLSVTGGKIKYAELYPSNSRPASLQWTGVRLTATGISNGKLGVDTTAHIRVSGMFQDAARMVVNMALPLAARDFSLSCHGVVDSLPLPSLNSFLEVAEGIRVVSGRADSITFAFNARQGKSSGSVRPIYRGLELKKLSKESGKSDGIAQKIGTLVANIKIKDDNLPEKSGEAREGRVHYVRKPDDPFFKFVWFSLRGGLGDVVGF